MIGPVMENAKPGSRPPDAGTVMIAEAYAVHTPKCSLQLSGGMSVNLRTAGIRMFTLVLIVASAATTTGCFDRQELEQQAFVTALGLDEAPDGMIDCTFRFAIPQNPSGGGGASSADTPLAAKAPVTYRAHSVTEAILIANSSVERKVTLTHLSNVLFGKTLAEKGLEPVMQSMVRYREFRPTILIGIANGKAREVMSAQKPMLDKTTSRMSESIALTAERTGLIPVVYLQDLRRITQNRQASGILPLFSLNQVVKDDPKGEQGVGTDQSVFEPGKEPRAGGDPVEWMGSVIFRGDKAVGILNGRQTQEVQFLKGELRSAKVDFTDPSKKSASVGLSVRRERVPHYTVQLTNPMRIDVEVPLEGDLLNVESGKDYSLPNNRTELEQDLDQRISKEYTQVLETLFHKYEADVIPVANHVRRKFLTDQAYRAFPWQQRLKTAEVHVRVQLHIRRFGVQMEPL